MSGLGVIGSAYQEALRCLDALTTLGGVGEAACTGDLGFLGMLLAKDRDVDRFINTVIGPVLKYDSEHGSDFVQTLDAYFESSGSPTRAAATLHVHTNTVGRRLDRITRLLEATSVCVPTLHRTGCALVSVMSESPTSSPFLGRRPSRGSAKQPRR